MKDELNLVKERWYPKIKWFKPPKIFIFRWAYNIRITLSTNTENKINPILYNKKYNIL